MMDGNTISLAEEDRKLIRELVLQLKIRNERDGRLGERLLSCREAARMIGVTPSTISVWIREGRLHKVERNSRTGILESEARLLMR